MKNLALSNKHFKNDPTTLKIFQLTTFLFTVQPCHYSQYFRSGPIPVNNYHHAPHSTLSCVGCETAQDHIAPDLDKPLHSRKKWSTLISMAMRALSHPRMSND